MFNDATCGVFIEPTMENTKTKFMLGLAALSITLIAPIAAQANNNTGADYGCYNDVINCNLSTNLVGKSVVSYGLPIGNGKAEDSARDLTKMDSGSTPIVKILKSATVLADDNNRAAHLDF
jgi:hypothetical protein